MHDTGILLLGGDPDRGREFVRAGQYTPPGMIDSIDVIAYRNRERELVARRGECSERCQCNLVEHNGRMLCPNTWRPCDRKRLCLIVELYSKVNS